MKYNDNSRVTKKAENRPASHVLSHVSHVVTPCDGISQHIEKASKNV